MVTHVNWWVHSDLFVWNRDNISALLGHIRVCARARARVHALYLRTCHVCIREHSCHVTRDLYK